MVNEKWEAAHKILCVRLDSLGDVIMTTPAIRAIKESHPERSVTLLTSPAGERAAGLIPEIDATIIYAAPWMKATATRADSSAEYRMADTLRRQGFDAAVIFTVFTQNPLPAAMLMYLADIPLRLAHCRENPYQLLTDWVPETDLQVSAGMRHEVSRQLDLVSNVGCSTEDERLSIRVPNSAYKKVQALLATTGLEPGRSWVVIHPGASVPSRRYPAAGYAQAAKALAQNDDLQVVFTGSSAEEPLVEEIRQAMAAPSISLVGCLDLSELAALLSMAPLLVSNNTGPVHIAAAVGTPVVGLYALTNPQHTPWGIPHRVLSYDVPCKYCFKSVCPLGHQDCLRLVPPEAVVQASLELLQETGNKNRQVI